MSNLAQLNVTNLGEPNRLTVRRHKYVLVIRELERSRKGEPR
jgi:hypothetical protein